MDISVVIPCHYSHHKYIDNLLKIYSQQTVLPKEIIIILCGFNKFDSKIDDFHRYPFDIKYLIIDEKSPAGKNRYLGSKEAKGDIIIFQDADDLPHMQRNEIIQKTFNNYSDIMHIVHSYTRKYNNAKFNINKIPIKIGYHNIFSNAKEMDFYKITNGNIAIRKEIVDDIEWELKKYRGQDVQLNKNIYNIFKKYIIITLPLYIYRENLTTRYIR